MLRKNFFTKISDSILRQVGVFSDVPCRNSSFCKNIVWRSENCLSLAEPTSFFRAPTGFLSKNFRIYTEHLIFFVTFFSFPSGEGRVGDKKVTKTKSIATKSSSNELIKMFLRNISKLRLFYILLVSFRLQIRKIIIQ